MIKLTVKTMQDDQFETICTREYDAESFVMPASRQVLTFPEEGEDSRYYVENVIHHLGEEQPEIQLIVRDEEELIADVRRKRQQKMRQFQQQMAASQGQQGGGGNPFGGGGGQGGGSPFSL